ncbi:amino acid decarboxylase [Xenorhabdus kozodoii]|uniref:Orn/DAP/Arg decarboxylase 2:Orn/DAP/Arg decarboxylase 2 n=1 Tax=Xenorhabdus kozodoii TaxID=351676 RepID=A0A2D0L4I8_9GAMM|nr:amino acid decarboxylase [Xenorhabdus kozodoii]PHM70606.1 Orn/DAP/Arg decarboxylase 2:Orn/DAP/Arg decarboxylase 2 [Xenorhabdus kozodoii]
MTGIINRLEQGLSGGQFSFESPCYIYDPTVLKDNINALEKELGTPVIISIKANPSVELNLRLIDRGVEVASLKELNLAVNCNKIYINNPSMDKNLMRAGIAAKAFFIIDTQEQLQQLIALAGNRPLQPVILRCNVDVVSSLLPDAPAIRKDHFGMDLTSLLAAARYIRDNEKVQLLGFHLFGGSHTFQRFATYIARAALALIPLIEESYGSDIALVNLGGGFGEHWWGLQESFAAYHQALSRFPQHIELVHEAGRATFASCGVFMTTVVGTKRIAGQHYAICDGGMNQNFLLCQTENSFRRMRQPYCVRKGSQIPLENNADQKTILVGSTCSRDDVIGHYPGEDIQAGDILLFDQCGAYHSTYTVNRFLGLKEAAYYVIS